MKLELHTRKFKTSLDITYYGQSEQDIQRPVLLFKLDESSDNFEKQTIELSKYLDVELYDGNLLTLDKYGVYRIVQYMCYLSDTYITE